MDLDLKKHKRLINCSNNQKTTSIVQQIEALRKSIDLRDFKAYVGIIGLRELCKFYSY